MSPPPAGPGAVRSVSPLRTLHWLRAGAADLLRAPLTGLLHGLAAAAFGAFLVLLLHDQFWLLAGALSGFLLVAPVVATGLYEISRRLEGGQSTTLHDVRRVWRSLDARLVTFGVLLAVAGTGWVLTSAALITGFAPVAVAKPADFIRHVMLHPDSWLFEAWLVLGAVLAAPVFASSVVAIPLLLDKPVGVLDAVLTSWRCVLANPFALALWGGLLLVLTALGMALAFVGLVWIVPWLAHASWHAYRDLVVADPG